MTEMKLAIENEIGKQYVEAVKYYEVILKDMSSPPVEVYINLAFLYWEFAIDYTFNNTYHIPEEWSLEGGKKYPIIITAGLAAYPQSAELHFWKKYFSHRLFTDEFTQHDCERIINKYRNPESIIPYFFLYLFDKNKYREKRNELLIKCEELPTAKNLYIKSILESGNN